MIFRVGECVGEYKLNNNFDIYLLNLCMETVIMHPENKEQVAALKAFAKALKVKFETSTYNADFVAKIKESTKQVKEGNYTTLDPDKSLWENIR